MLMFGIVCQLMLYAVTVSQALAQAFLLEYIIELILRTLISFVFQPLCLACFLGYSSK